MNSAKAITGASLEARRLIRGSLVAENGTGSFMDGFEGA